MRSLPEIKAMNAAVPKWQRAKILTAPETHFDDTDWYDVANKTLWVRNDRRIQIKEGTAFNGVRCAAGPSMATNLLFADGATVYVDPRCLELMPEFADDVRPVSFQLWSGASRYSEEPCDE